MTMGRRLFRNIATPLEVVDGALDSVAQVVQLPGRVAQNGAEAVSRAASGFNQGIQRPESYGDIPAPPDVVIGGALESVNSVVSGALDGVGGVIKSVTETADGVRRQIDQTFRR